MADSFGLKIGVEGEREFKDSLRDINQSFKVLGSEMNLVTSQFEKNDKSVGAAAARSAVLNKEIDAQKEKISTLESALKNASDSFGENDKRTQAWQIQLNNAQAALNGMERELAESADGADNLGDELDESGKSAEQSGSKFEQLGGILKGIGVAMGAVVVAAGAAAIKLGKVELKKRKSTGQRQSGLHSFSSRIVCGKCGSFYGPKVLHSNTQYRRTIWRCNSKYKNGHNCQMPHFYEAAIQKAFVEAFNRLYTDREQLLEDYGYFISLLTDTSSLDAEAAAQASERDISEGLIRKCVQENARVALNQDEYQQRYDALAARYEAAQRRLADIATEKRNRAAKRESVSRFMDTFRRSGLQAEFNEGLWCETVESVTVHSEKDVAFSFRDGSVIHVDARMK